MRFFMTKNFKKDELDVIHEREQAKMKKIFDKLKLLILYNSLKFQKN